MARLLRPRSLPPAYIGPVATRCRINQNKATGGPYAFTKRTYHYARDNITWLKIGYPNWFANLNSGEAGAGATTGLAASIEYPFTVSTVGTTCKMITWGGATTFTAPDNATAWSDWLYCPIPMGARFASRLFVNVTTNNCFNDPATYGGVWRDTAGGDVLDFSGTNLTAGGTMTDDGSQIDAGPIIVGYTRRPTIAIVGDSRASGWRDTVDLNAGEAGETARSYAKQFACLNLAVGGDTLASFIASAGSASVLRRQLAGYCSHIACNMAVNDISALVAAGTVEANITAMLGLSGLVGKPTTYDLILPESTSSDGFATTANQTVAAYKSVIDTVNTWLASGVSAITNGVNDPRTADEFPPIPSGKWIAPGRTSDGTHATQAGYQAIMNGGCVDPAKIVRRR